jgi:peptidoglycan/xylan/chitin deacetylase (PgdA/CDA1 family)
LKIFVHYSVLVLVFSLSIFSQSASATLYDGTKAAVSVTFEHAFSNQLTAIDANMSDMNATIAVITQRVGNSGYMTQQQLLDLQNRGFEIASHSETHKEISTSTPPDQLYYETVQSKFDLEKMGFKVSGFVPPLNKETIQSFALIQKYYGWTEFFNPITNSTYHPEYSSLQELNYSKQHFGIYNEPIWGVGHRDDLRTVDDVKAKIDYAIANKLWVALKFHGIVTTTGTYDTSPTIFHEIIQYIRDQKSAGNLLVITRSEGVGLGATAPSVSIALSNQTSCESSPISGTWNGIDTCTVSSLAINFGDSVTINSGIVLVNSGAINNSGIINNFGTLSNMGTINNSGTINNECGAVYSGTVPTGNTINNIACPVNTIISNQTSCESVPISGIWNETNTCTVSSLAINFGDSVTINSGIILVNSGLIDNSGNFNNSGTLNNNGTMDNGGTLFNSLNSSINNFATINNYDTITNNGTINNSGTMHNYEFNILENSGTLNNNLSSTIINDGTINNSGTITSRCEFTYYGTPPNVNSIIDECVSCIPDSGDWIINSTCQLSTSAIVTGNVTVQNNSALVIQNGTSLDIDFATKHLLIKSGSKVLIKSGGKIH